MPTITSARRLVVLSHSAHWNGAERCLFRLLRALNRAEFHPLVLFPEEGHMAAAVREIGIETKVVKVESWIQIGHSARNSGNAFHVGLPGRVNALAALLVRERAALALTNTGVVAELALAAHQTGTPHLWWLHELLGRNPELNPL